MKAPKSGLRVLTILAVLLVVTMIAPACGPSKATIKVTLIGEDGLLLPDMTVSAGDKSAKTDSKGVATLKGMAPGQVTLRFAGGGYLDERSVTVKAGNNALSYQLEPLSNVWPIRPFAELARMRVRIHQSDDNGTPATEGTFVRGKGVHWKMADGSEVISLGDSVYVKPKGQAWQRLQAGGAGHQVAEAIVKMANQMYGEIQAFEARVLDSAAQIRSLGREEVRGYDCRIFGVNWSSANQSGQYIVYVIARGQHKGFVTCYYASADVERFFNFYDLDGAHDIAPPM